MPASAPANAPALEKKSAFTAFQTVRLLACSLKSRRFGGPYSKALLLRKKKDHPLFFARKGDALYALVF